jgi:hypothetical protein
LIQINVAAVKKAQGMRGYSAWLSLLGTSLDDSHVGAEMTGKGIITSAQEAIAAAGKSAAEGAKALAGEVANAAATARAASTAAAGVVLDKVATAIEAKKPSSRAKKKAAKRGAAKKHAAPKKNANTKKASHKTAKKKRI